MQKWPLGGALSGCPPGRWNFEQKKEQGDCILPALSFSTNTKGVRYVRIFQRISIGVRVATWVFTHHSEQVVSISALWTSLYRGQRKSLRIHSGQDITKSRKILLRYYGLFTSHLSNSSERFLLFFNYQKANT